ncbi:glycerophosphodiester phosphodiesterase family protein [Halomonas sp. V046]|uniref:glycerophosphodiester phosphodiesterase family protein n=1 Tax=Halomonas sp. V046 TaxID=3459611 RepID=UPI0040444612
MNPLVKDVLASLRDHLRPLLAYHLLFTLLASSLLLPAIGWTLAAWSGRVGRPIVTTMDALHLLLSPNGLAWAYAGACAILTVLYLQQAGMMLMAIDRRGSHARQALAALWLSLHRLPAALGLAMLQVACHLAMLVVVAVCVAALHSAIIGNLDPYYIRRIRPPAFWQFIAACLPLLGTWAWLAGRLFVHWWLALPCLVLERISPLAALRRSLTLTRHRLPGMAAAVFGMLGVILVLPVLASAAFSKLAAPLLAGLPNITALVVPVMLVVVTLVILLTLAIAFAAIALNALLAACLYLRLAHREPRPEPPPADAHPGRLAWGVEVGVIIFAISQAWLMLDRHEIRDNVSVIAHRGSSQVAPENSLSAIRQALSDGADQVEIDVRLSADGTPVLSHDASLSRLAGDNRRIAEVNWAALADVDIGSSFGHAFAGEGLASLAEALAAVRGRAGLVIELKPDQGNEASLLAAVMTTLVEERDVRRTCRDAAVDALARIQCGNPRIFKDTWLATLSYRQLVRIDEQAPQARTLLLAEWSLPGGLPRHRFNALGLRHTRIDESERRRAKHYGDTLYAWTVNDADRMARLIDLGVDGIITDRPERLRAILRERSQLGDGALLLLKLRHWLADS